MADEAIVVAQENDAALTERTSAGRSVSTNLLLRALSRILSPLPFEATMVSILSASLWVTSEYWAVTRSCTELVTAHVIVTYRGAECSYARPKRLT